MQFPISVYKVDDQIFLLQGEITEDFKSKLDEVPYLGGRGKICSRSEPALYGSTIYVNGDTQERDYIIDRTFCIFVDNKFENFQKLIKYYAEQMGYEC